MISYTYSQIIYKNTSLNSKMELFEKNRNSIETTFIEHVLVTHVQKRKMSTLGYYNL